MRKSILALAAALAMLPVFARAGPVMKEAETQYALSQLADVAIANTRCDLQPPDAHFKLMLALNRQGWADEEDANLAVRMRPGQRHMTPCPNRNGWPNAKKSPTFIIPSMQRRATRASRTAPSARRCELCWIQATGAEFRRVSPSGERVFLYHPISDEINFSCAAHGLTPDISLGWEKGAAPSKAWVALAVKAAQVITDEPAKTLRSGIDKCYRDALADPSTEMASMELPKSKIDCQAFARDGGAGSMTFYIDDIKDRANN